MKVENQFFEVKREEATFAENERLIMSIIGAFGVLTEMRDNETGGHIHKTQKYVEIIAHSLMQKNIIGVNLDMRDVLVLSQVSPLHDIGKVGIPDSIILKPSKLTNEEYNIMKSHVLLGQKAINSIRKQYDLESNRYLKSAEKVIVSHHEKWDGTGYPYGLSGKDIPIEGRIMAIADVYDALRSKRVYKPEFSHTMSINMMIGEKGSHFDPVLIDILIENEHLFEYVSTLDSDEDGSLIGMKGDGSSTKTKETKGDGSLTKIDFGF